VVVVVVDFVSLAHVDRQRDSRAAWIRARGARARFAALMQKRNTSRRSAATKSSVNSRRALCVAGRHAQCIERD
jgi:hypothetical protein